MELLLQRELSDAQKTFGKLFEGSEAVYLCETLEDVVRAVKIKGQTAIPAGRYLITMETSPRFGPDTITVNGVTDFSGVRIHAGNTEADTEGCPLVGLGRSAVGITQSKAALAMLKPKIKAALDAGEEVWLTVINAEGEVCQ